MTGVAPKLLGLENKHVAIFSLEDDLHALMIRKTMQERFGVPCSFIVTNQLSRKGDIVWSLDSSIRPTLRSFSDDPIDIRSLDLVWWRRSGYSQTIPHEIDNPSHIDVINNDCREALLGMLLTEFRGTWISDPHATRVAENKLVQLRVAARAGFRTPRTLVSQDPSRVKDFCSLLRNKVVIKTVKGTVKASVLTTALDDRLFDYPDSIKLSPAIYQELIPGKRHVRAHCFGNTVLAAEIECDLLDWRPALDSSARPYEVSEIEKQRLRAVLGMLGLKMGIFDFKLTDNNELVWLEINPQGQFLFIQGMCDLDLETAFCEFLCSEMISQST